MKDIDVIITEWPPVKPAAGIINDVHIKTGIVVSDDHIMTHEIQKQVEDFIQ